MKTTGTPDPNNGSSAGCHRTMDFPRMEPFSVFFEHEVFRMGFPHILTKANFFFSDILYPCDQISMHVTVTLPSGGPSAIASAFAVFFSLSLSLSLQSISQDITSVRPRRFLANFLHFILQSFYHSTLYISSYSQRRKINNQKTAALMIFRVFFHKVSNFVFRHMRFLYHY